MSLLLTVISQRILIQFNRNKCLSNRCIFANETQVAIKIGSSGFDEVDECRFSLVLIGEGSTGEKVTEVLEKIVVGRREVWGVW